MNVVDDKSVVKINKYYNVRCAKIKVEGGKIVYVPIIGEMHNDAQFGVYYFHYHLDGRFINRIHESYQVDQKRTYQHRYWRYGLHAA